MHQGDTKVCDLFIYFYKHLLNISPSHTLADVSQLAGGFLLDIYLPSAAALLSPRGLSRAVMGSGGLGMVRNFSSPPVPQTLVCSSALALFGLALPQSWECQRAETLLEALP